MAETRWSSGRLLVGGVACRARRCAGASPTNREEMAHRRSCPRTFRQRRTEVQIRPSEDGGGGAAVGGHPTPSQRSACIDQQITIWCHTPLCGYTRGPGKGIPPLFVAVQLRLEENVVTEPVGCPPRTVRRAGARELEAARRLHAYCNSDGDACASLVFSRQSVVSCCVEEVNAMKRAREEEGARDECYIAKG